MLTELILAASLVGAAHASQPEPASCNAAILDRENGYGIGFRVTPYFAQVFLNTAVPHGMVQEQGLRLTETARANPNKGVTFSFVYIYEPEVAQTVFQRLQVSYLRLMGPDGEDVTSSDLNATLSFEGETWSSNVYRLGDLVTQIEADELPANFAEQVILNQRPMTIRLCHTETPELCTQVRTNPRFGGDPIARIKEIAQTRYEAGQAGACALGI